ncbi:hypothetical protein AB0M29_07715 [Streptomyces sp. NPDC051976]|uniref:hypothetical protein n=1 Tax=Streptomyces sp. NPDC051976 TaxID=3154947 RepID=UPI003421617C
MAAAEYPEDDDALFVLTAAMLTPGRFPGVLGDDYPAACAELGLEPMPDGYGLVFGQDGAGARWTVATTDAAMVACALAAWDCGLEYDLSPDENSLAASLPGWPLPVAVSVPGIPDPHDPTEEDGGRAPLSPPDTSVWGPPQRRLGADEIAVRWHEWRDQLDAETAEPEAAEPEATEPADTTEAAEKAQPTDTVTDPADAESPAGTAETAETAESDTKVPDSADAPDTSQVPDAETSLAPASDAASDASSDDAAPQTGISHKGIRHVLESAEEYVRNPPPPGRVRTVHGAVRADGPGWSLVARTDDIAFVLLDDAPGEVLPVGRGPSLPPLLEALSKLAAASA